MADSGGYQEPKLGATFYPGGQDDFLMPELISPSPQRIMPEVPSNMQEGLALLELEANEISPVRGRRMSSVSEVSQIPDHYADHRVSTISDVSNSQDRYADHRVSAMSTSHSQERYAEPRGPPQQPQGQTTISRGYTVNYQHTNAATYQNLNAKSLDGAGDGKNASKSEDVPFPSPFPQVRNPGPSIPPSDDEKEEVLERTRSAVLTSNDPEKQLAWAQDALLWVETAVQSRVRLAGDTPALGRPATPRVEHHIRVDAISIVNHLANQSHPKAEFMKATWHEFGKFGYPLDRKEAFQGYRRASERGYARAEYRIGTQYESMQDMMKAIKHYNIGVAKGDAASYYRMGMMSLLGQHGQLLDYREAIEKIRFAAENSDENSPQGAYVYGMLLGRELPNISIPDHILEYDADQAKMFLEKSAYLGFAKAQLKMGQAYELCFMGCDFDPALSLHYNALAARQGEAEADMAISKWFLCGFEGVFEKNDELAYTYALRAVKGGLATAEFALGYFNEIGMHVPIDLVKARDWYEKAADHGNTDALARIEALKQHKALSKKDNHQEAITRIRSQYGSKRGGRPDRLRERIAAQTQLPVISDEGVDMPDPARFRSPSVSGIGPSPVENIIPPRSKSTAPYPDDDDDIRPHDLKLNTASAYQNQPPQRLSGPPADRPNSAFGIRALHNPANNIGAQNNVAQDNRRPYSTTTNLSVPDGRVPNPAARKQVVSAGWEPQAPAGYRKELPQIQSQGFPQPEMGRQQLGDPSPAGRNRLQKPSPNMGKPQPPLPPKLQVQPQAPIHPGYPNDTFRGNVSPAAPRHGVQPNKSYPQYDQRNDLPSQRLSGQGSQRPDRLEPQPPPQDYNRMAPRPLSAQSAPVSYGPARPVSAAPSTASAASAPGRPLKEGPKTFDEMGIPQKKNESDCCVM